MAILIIDPVEAKEVRARYVGNGGTSDERFTEVWNGAEVVPPRPNDEHQEIQFNLGFPIAAVVSEPGHGRVRGAVNVRDRADGWVQNHRGPDLVVYLNTNPAINHGTHWQGGPDFLVEILSPGEDPYAKFVFYAGVNTRGVLLTSRDPWAIELHRLRNGRLELSGRCDEASPASVVSEALPLSFGLRVGPTRPVIVATHPGSGREWVV